MSESFSGRVERLSSDNKHRFHRPAFHDQEHLLSEWSLPLTLHLLSVDNLLTFITACLLEKKVIVHSSNVRFISAVVYVAPLPMTDRFQSHQLAPLRNAFGI